VKKLRIEELHVESFTTSAQPAPRGTVMGLATEVATCPATCGLDGNSCGMDCATEAWMQSCAANNCGDSFDPNCNITTGPGTSEGTLCNNTYAAGCSDSCTAPYGCGCTTTMSYDYTFCQTMCC
jgi:hypothetical protein